MITTAYVLGVASVMLAAGEQEMGPSYRHTITPWRYVENGIAYVDGYVGIGTSAPQTVLHVIGDVRCQDGSGNRTVVLDENHGLGQGSLELFDVNGTNTVLLDAQKDVVGGGFLNTTAL